MRSVPRSGAVLLALACFMTLWLAACSGGGGQSTATRPVATTTAAAGAGTSAGATGVTAASGGLTIRGFAFSPEHLRAKVGDTITVTNGDSTAHTVTANDGSFDTRNIAASAMATIHLGRAGTFGYHCNIHQFMTASITVT